SAAPPSVSAPVYLLLSFAFVSTSWSLITARVQICAGSEAAVEDIGFPEFEDCSRVSALSSVMVVVMSVSGELRGLASRGFFCLHFGGGEVFLRLECCGLGDVFAPCFKELSRVSISRFRLSSPLLVAWLCARTPTLSCPEKILLLVLSRGIRERMWRASVWSIGVFLPLWRRVRDSQVLVVEVSSQPVPWYCLCLLSLQVQWVWQSFWLSPFQIKSSVQLMDFLWFEMVEGSSSL
ncbi:hypothetical protein HID58_047694, partial [Brassica napus]